jgi:hypothetical protein
MFRSSCVRRPQGLVLASLVVIAFASCGGGAGGSSGGAPPGTPGTEVAKPGGGTFFLDPHHEGSASRLHLVECEWGRLVDVHALDASGDVVALPEFRDLLIGEDVQGDGLDYRLETNAITQRRRLVVLRQRGAADEGNGTFEELLTRARSSLPPILASPTTARSAVPSRSWPATAACRCASTTS